MSDQTSGFDDLSQFAAWYLSSRPLLVPAENSLSFYETAVGIVLYRQPPYQVQLFIAYPATPIVPHTHPNVDSFEVFLNGMEFSHCGNVLISMQDALRVASTGFPQSYGVQIRVRPTDEHGGIGSSAGGAFLSIQKWLNGVSPTCVAADWHGDPMGPKHEEKITSK